MLLSSFHHFVTSDKALILPFSGRRFPLSAAELPSNAYSRYIRKIRGDTRSYKVSAMTRNAKSTRFQDHQANGRVGRSEFVVWSWY